MAVIFLLRFARPAVVTLFVLIGITIVKTMAVIIAGAIILDAVALCEGFNGSPF